MTAKDYDSLFMSIKQNDDEQSIVIDIENNGKLLDSLVKEIPILPLTNTVLFPLIVIPITATREMSIKLVKDAFEKKDLIGVVSQKNDTEVPTEKDLYRIGTVAEIVKMIVLPNGGCNVILKGIRRFQLTSITNEKPYLKGTYNLQNENFRTNNKQINAHIKRIRDISKVLLSNNNHVPKEAKKLITAVNLEKYVESQYISTKSRNQKGATNINAFLLYFIASNLITKSSSKQQIINELEDISCLKKLFSLLREEKIMHQVKMEIQKKVHTDIDQQQRDFYLRQQMKVLQDELGEESPAEFFEKLSDRAKEKKWSKEAEDHFKKELLKLERTNPQAPDYAINLNYIEYFLDLPWNEYSKDVIDLKKAEKILNRDHYGLEKVKKRIIEYLAVLKLKKNLRGPILCLTGPPGVGKTSLGKSVAEALGRSYVRMSLGGVSDEAEIRGHRKTYIGALPGKMIQNIKKAKTSNPVFILDEVDKLQRDFRGDPSSALLEVLDPEQNSTFVDNYLEVPYDLSKVLFITTANDLSTIQPALLDRMEVIDLTGYILEEKINIAQRHLIPRQIDENGLKKSHVQISKQVISKLIANYTRESGVRSLERQIGSVIRHVATKVAMKKKYKKNISVEEIPDILGIEMFESEISTGNELPGIVTGLAWTRYGGEILFIETALSSGTGKITLSGKLGDVMKESANTAFSYLKTIAERLKIDNLLFKQYDLHLHVPQGAVPKDGPSAGIAILTALASIYTLRKVKKSIAMTGEITLTGKVLPIGGVKEKILAAKRAGIKEIILPDRNKKDINDLNKKYIKGLKIFYVKWAYEVLSLILLSTKPKGVKPWKIQSPRK